MAKRPASTKADQRSPAKKAKVQPDAPRGILKKSGSSAGADSTSIASKNAAKTQDFSSNSHKDVKGKGKAAGERTLKLPSASSIPPKPATAFEVVAGSYERILYGLHCTPSGVGSDAKVEMQPIFQFPAHLSGVKSVATSPNGRWLVTGSADEVIKVWDLRRRKEVGGLVGHEGDITCLVFPSDKYLVSGSADGTLCLFRTKDWSMLRRFKGHKGRINSVAVHPQGRVALTVSKDRCLRLWDLLGKSTAKGSSSTRLGAEGDLVRWNSKGDRFAVICDRELRIFTTDMTPLRSFASQSRFHDVAFTEKDGQELLLVAGEDGKVRIYRDLAEGVHEDEDEGTQAQEEHIAELTGFSNRVKSISIVQVLGQQLVAAISSDGTIKSFSLSSLDLSGTSQDPQVIEPVSSYDTRGSRLTCMAAVAVKDDRTTTYAESVISGGDSDSSDADSDIDISEQETFEAEEEAEAILAGLNGKQDDNDAETSEEEHEDGEDAADAQEDSVAVDEEWAGIGN